MMQQNNSHYTTPFMDMLRRLINCRVITIIIIIGTEGWLRAELLLMLY